MQRAVRAAHIATPRATTAFHWAMGIASLLLSGGGVLDNWAHFHGLVDRSFFTPWHAVMYGMMAAFGIVLGSLAVRNVLKGYYWTNSLPSGYVLSLVGVVCFIVAGLIDLGWHMLFGIEQATSAFVSPTHILLCASGLLVGTGPFRAAWLTLSPAAARGWRMLGPLVLSATAALVALGMFTQFASPLNDMLPALQPFGGGAPSPVNTQSFGVAEVIVQTALFMSVILVLASTWRLPFGSMLVLITIPSLTQLIMNDHYWLAIGAVGAGLAADLLLAGMHPPLRGRRLYALAATVPIISTGSMFAAIAATAGLAWPVTLTLGTMLYASVTGLFIGFLLDWPVRRSPLSSDIGTVIAIPSYERDLVSRDDIKPLILSGHKHPCVNGP